MASVIAIWCPTRQCEVSTGLVVNEPEFDRLRVQASDFTCIACGRTHTLRNAYLRALNHFDRKSSSPQPRAVRRRPDAH
jgi:hypothetical protein